MNTVKETFSQWKIYINEMYPTAQSLGAALLLSGALYFLTVLTCEVPFELSIREITGCLTVYCALLFLRIADDFKDEELDKRLFPDRPYPSGRINKKNLKILLFIDTAVMLAANIAVMSVTSLIWFGALMTYMILMCVWFFQKKKIQSSLILALVTHNPCMILMNYYILSITCERYELNLMTLDFFAVNLMLYLPALEYEISRKIKAPSQENAYVTYSKTLGFRNSVLFLLTVSFIELAATEFIAFKYFPKIWCLVFLCYYLAYCIYGISFINNPLKKRVGIGQFARIYIFIMQGSLIVASIIEISFR